MKPLAHQLTKHTKFLHKVALESQGQVLILKRSTKAKSRPGKWDLPGGNSEWPQNQTQVQQNLHRLDIAREIQEETGLIIDHKHFNVKNLVFFTSYFEPDKKVYSINCGWQVKNLEPQLKTQVKISPEHTDSTWINLEQLANYDFGGPARDYETQVIRQVLSKKPRC